MLPLPPIPPLPPNLNFLPPHMHEQVMRNYRQDRERYYNAKSEYENTLNWSIATMVVFCVISLIVSIGGLLIAFYDFSGLRGLLILIVCGLALVWCVAEVKKRL